MPKRTLLEMVQEVSDAIDGDEISALNETVEADQLEKLVLNTLEDLVTRQDWEFLKDKLLQLDNGTTVISLNIPSTISKIQTVQYVSTSNSKPKTLRYIDPLRYMDIMQQVTSGDPGTVDVIVNGVTLVARTNSDPRWWTILEDAVFVDGFDISRDTSGVVGTQSVTLATKYFDFSGSVSGSWVAPLPEKMFGLWLQESIAEASVKLRQVEDPREERKARRQFVSQSRDEPVFRRDEGFGGVNYGRR